MTINAAPQDPSLLTAQQVRELCRAALVRGRYKYLRVTVRNGRVRVSAPLSVSKAEIERFIERHLADVKRWLAEQHDAMLNRRRSNPLCADLRDGGRVAYLGEPLTIVCRPEAPHTERATESATLWVRAHPSDVEGIGREVRGWLSKRFAERLAERMAFWSRATGLVPRAVKPSSACTRWGSCTRAGLVRVSWRTICLPPDVLDYVIVHELSHLKHFDHSPAFWTTVRRFYPSADRVRAALKTVHAQELA